MRALGLLLLSACGLPIGPSEVAQQGRSVSISGRGTHVLVETTADQRYPLRVFGEDVPPGIITIPASVAVARGSSHACVLSTTGTVHCWGDHTNGALGEHRRCLPPLEEGGPLECGLPPGMLPTLPPSRAIAAGRDVTCATTLEDRVVCWGDPALLGGSRLPEDAPPTPVSVDGAPLAAERVLIFDRTVCAIAKDGVTWCWGGGFAAEPVRRAETGVVDLAIGPRHACVIEADGLRCEGDDRFGQVSGLDPAIARFARRVVVGTSHTCVLTSGGEVHCFGSDEFGQLGGGLVTEGAIELDSGAEHACARSIEDAVLCWGDFGLEVIASGA